MSSTRSSSPVDGASAPTSPQLTPRSKIKAMLAAVDNSDSDDGAAGPIDTKLLFKSIDETRTLGHEVPESRSAQVDDIEDQDEEEEEEDVVQPRGRLAARMRGEHAATPKTASKSPDDSSARVEKTIQAETMLEDSTPRGKDIGQDEEDDDEEIVALPRRRPAGPRSTTPEAANDVDTPPSPGLFVSPLPRKPAAPRHSVHGSDTEDDQDFPEDLSKSDRFKALVERKRKERLAKEAEEERKRQERAERMAAQMPADSDADDDVSDISDDDGGRKLTQEVSRPARKASKKALEEMNRETQRLSRSMQLAHEAKTKKKISKASLFERFNFRAEVTPNENKLSSSSRPTTPVSAHQTDVETGDGGTPPSSPPTFSKQNPPISTAAPQSTTITEDLDPEIDENENENDELPDILAALKQLKRQDKGKGKAVESPATVVDNQKPRSTKPRRQVRVKLPLAQTNLVTIDLDDELEITKAKKGRLDAIFDKVPAVKAEESKSMNVLRQLAHLSSPPKDASRGRNAKPSMTTSELQMSLQQRARTQAKLERERRLEALRAKGVVLQSAEERERQREEVEDIVARARKEVEEIMQRERDDAKKLRKESRENGEGDPLAWDESDDESFQGSEKEDPADIELSGSEEEEENSGSDDDAIGDELEEEVDNEDENPAINPLFMDEADEVDESEQDEIHRDIEEIASDDELDELPSARARRPKKHVKIISDDEDEGNDVEATPKPKITFPKSPSAPGSSSPKIPTSVLRSATKSFIPGLPIPVACPAGLGLTQIFAGTMDDSQGGLASGSPQEFMPTLDQFPNSQFSATAGESQNDDMIVDSQPGPNLDSQAHETQTQALKLHFSQSQAHGFDSLLQADATQLSDLIEPTQDGGFQDFSPLKQRFVEPPPSTIDTVLLDSTANNDDAQDSPLVKKKGKLRRRGETMTPVSSTLPPTEVPKSPSLEPTPLIDALGENDSPSADAFRLMEKAAKRNKRLQEKFDKRKSKANEMVEVQAEESEDEYAGLGGADGEDSSEEDEELAKEMIDDAERNDLNEAKLAGLFADRERAADAAQVDKLFRDITTGMLRKRRRGGGGNNDFDLSDSDDGGEARRRMKRRQFAKMQKALFADERIGKIAENPRNAAFLKSIEDRNSGDEWDFNDHFEKDVPQVGEEESQQAQSQYNSTSDQSIPDSQPTSSTNNLGRKRTRTDDHARRPPPGARPPKDDASLKPSSLTEVRRSLSSLLEEPNGSIGSMVPATEIGSDSEEEEREQQQQHPSTSTSDKENTAIPGPNKRTNGYAVVDRISLRREPSASLLASTSRLAFAAPSASGGGTFKVPALLRRATTNSLMSSSSATASSSSTVAGGGGAGAGAASLSKRGGSFSEEGKLKKNAGKRSGVNYFARENERRAKVQDAERRREAKKWKGAEGRGKVVGGLFGGGKFE